MAHNSWRDDAERRGSFGEGRKERWNNDDRRDRRPREDRGGFQGSGKRTFGGKSDNGPVEFEREFYQEHQEVAGLKKEEVEKIRKEFDMGITGSNIPNPCMNFEHLGFPISILKEFSRAGYTTPTPIQAQGWPMALSGRDMVGIANTGSGKTLSFILPAMIHAKAQAPLRRGDGPIVLVLAPTRELAVQIEEEAAKYIRYFGLRSAAVYGGVSYGPQREKIDRGVEILIATPGRLIDLYERRDIFLSRVTFLVLDEADRMLDMGFEPQLRKIIPETSKKRQTLMWSATWPKEVRDLAKNYMSDYIQVKIGSAELVANAKIVQKTYVVERFEKDEKLSELLGEVGGDEKNTPKIIIFCNQKRQCDELADKMQEHGWPAESLHGDKAQMQRTKIINDFKSGKRSILVATDVAARGLDVKDVKAVINYDFPGNCEDYIHRIGRTARGNSEEGHSFTFFCMRDDRGNAKKYVEILRETKQEVPTELISAASMRGDSSSFGGNRRYGSMQRVGGPRGGKRW